jgi:stage V sporulation protein D (sporulation-specific penicillin-binding protein)
VAIGQEVGVTAIQMVRAAAIVANGGLLVQPRIVEAIVKRDGGRERVDSPPPVRVMKPETAALMRAMMEFTVQEGTGRLARTPGYRVGGKTGTAQKVDPETGAYSRTQHVPNFIGFAPVNDPAVVAVIVLDSPAGQYHGGQVAGPIFPQIATQALRFLDVAADQPVTPGKGSSADRLAAVRPEALVDFQEEVSRLDSSLVPARFEREADGSFVVAAGRRAGWRSGPAPAFDRSSVRPVRLRVAEQALPNFQGQTVRAVVGRAAALGLQLQVRGAGRALRQWPSAGAPISRGDDVLVEFGTPPERGRAHR